MKALAFYEHGGLDTLSYTEVPMPTPGPNEALVQVKAVALNRLDLWTRAGIPGLHLTMPHIGGSDIAGVVTAVGANGDSTWVGKRVVINPALSCGKCEYCVAGEHCLCVSFRILGEHTPGGMAEYAVAPITNLYAIPDDFPFVEAAAVPLCYQTAWRALISQARLRAGERVLIIGAGGGVASAAIQIAKLTGAYVYAVTSTADKERRAIELGADETINYKQTDFAKEVWKRTNKRGVDVVLENVGPATWKNSVRSLRKGGRLVTYGATTGRLAETDLNVLFWNQPSLIGSTMATYAEFAEVMGLVFSRTLRPIVDRILPLSEGKQAQAILEAGEQFGKIVLEP